MEHYLDMAQGSSSLPQPRYAPQQPWADSLAFVSPSDISATSSPELSRLQGSWSYPASESSGFDVSVLESPSMDQYDPLHQDIFTPELPQSAPVFFDPNWSWDAPSVGQPIPSPTSYYQYQTDLNSPFQLDAPFQTPSNSPVRGPVQITGDAAFDGMGEILSCGRKSTESTRTSASSGSGKDKPMCFEHGCNGRVFSSWSNLRRHQRERSRQTPQCYCPRCGAHFSRTTARKQHIANASCTRIRRYSNGRIRPSTLKLLESLMEQK